MKTIVPQELPVPQLHAHLLGVVAPRPIAFASTVDREGRVNLSPFSFFNVFSANPPILVFSPARGGRDGKLKNTLENIYEVPEVVINIVDYGMVEQMSLASTAYPKGVNEFVKAGFTELASEAVRPPRVRESKAQLECRVNDVVVLGESGGAGHLVVCELLRLHLDESILDEAGKVDTRRLDLVGRMGGDWYCRASGAALFEVEKPIARLGIGIDRLPEGIRGSRVLTGNHLGKLANIEAIPTAEALAGVEVPEVPGAHPHEQAAQLLDRGLLLAAWKVLLA
jgi:flavin reductase (DIM6/NTAB) family NADH-FMN oxidoreductase RutF